MRPHSAEGAEYESQGQARSGAERVVPGNRIKGQPSPEKGVIYFGPSGLGRARFVTRGDALASLALAPGFYISRRWRSLPNS
jgi:hypothetical protein